MKFLFLRGKMIHPSYGIIIPNSLSHLKAGKTRTFLILITLCKDADLDARAGDFYLFYMHKTKGSLDGEEFNSAKEEKLEISKNSISKLYRLVPNIHLNV